jgi:hypothetical protein
LFGGCESYDVNLGFFSIFECSDVNEVRIISGNPSDKIVCLWSSRHDVPLSLLKPDDLVGLGCVVGDVAGVRMQSRRVLPFMGCGGEAKVMVESTCASQSRNIAIRKQMPPLAQMWSR